MDRDFKGIWIPKEIWLNKELSIQEKVFLSEIDSLDNEDGCFASNTYFAEFFGLTKSRCSQIINSLQDKGLIEISYKFNGATKEIEKRIIKVCVKYFKYPIKNIKGGCLENAKDNNTLNNNTYLYDYMVSNSDEIQNNPFDFQIVISQINNSCKKIIEEGSKLSYEIDDYIEIFRYFYDGYKAYAGQAHPRIKSNYIKDVSERLPYIENDSCVGASDVDPEDNKTLIDSYFKQPWGVDINPTILHFMSGNIRALRFYETLY